METAVIEAVPIEIPEAPIETALTTVAPSGKPAEIFSVEFLQQQRAEPQAQSLDPEWLKAAEEEKPPKPFTKEFLQKREQPKPAAVKPPKHVLVDYFGNPKSKADPHDALVAYYEHHGAKRYEQFLDAVIEAHEDDIRARLRIARPSHIAEEDLRQLPKHLRETAANLSPDVWETVSRSPRHVGLQILEDNLAAQRAREAEYADEEKVYEERIKAAATRADDLGQRLADEHGARYAKGLEAWKPFGADEKQNQAFRDLVIRDAAFAMQCDPEGRDYERELHRALHLSEAHALANDRQEANRHLTHARELARTMSQALEDRTRAAQTLLAPIIRDALKWRESQKAPKVKEQPKIVYRNFQVQQVERSR